MKLKPRAATAGAAALELPDTAGATRTLPAGPARRPATVVVWTCNHCPYALAWHDRLVDVARDYADRGVRFLAVNSNDAERYPADSPEAMRERVEREELAVSLPLRRDPGGGARVGRAGHAAPVRARRRAAAPLRGRARRRPPGPRARAPPGCARRSTPCSPGAEPPAEHRAGRLLDQVEAEAAVTERRRAGPRPGLLGEPRARLRRARGGARRSSSSSRSTEAGEFSVDRRRRRRRRPTARTSACAPSSACTRPTACASRSAREIPLARGLGSSAAAIVAGLVAADHMFELGLEREAIYAHAVELEGHPDNVAAALYGGFVLCPQRRAPASAPPAPVRLEPPRGRRGGARDPARRVVPTAEARAAMPAGGRGRRRGRQRRRGDASSCSGSSAPTSP